ncbi:MAG: hypothetical protein NTY19_36840 [Planctomycetota bacterium]|nr:hypothetical protein [Planctomycetota bacterium]
MQQVRCGVERASQTLQTLLRPDAAPDEKEEEKAEEEQKQEEEQKVTESSGGQPVLLCLCDLGDDRGLPVGVLLQNQVCGNAANL